MKLGNSTILGWLRVSPALPGAHSFFEFPNPLTLVLLYRWRGGWKGEGEGRQVRGLGSALLCSQTFSLIGSIWEVRIGKLLCQWVTTCLAMSVSPTYPDCTCPITKRKDEEMCPIFPLLNRQTEVCPPPLKDEMSLSSSSGTVLAHYL